MPVGDYFRILITTQSVLGYQNYVRFMQFARRLVERGHHVTLFTANPQSTLRTSVQTIDGVRVVAMPGFISWRFRRGALEPMDILGRAMHVLREPYDIVHCDGHRPASFFQALSAKMARGTPWISEWVDLFGGEGVAGHRKGVARHIAAAVETRWEEWVRLMADGVIAISRGLYQRALQIGVPPERLVYIPGGADVERMPFRTVREARSALGLDPEAMIVGLIGYEEADRDDAALVLDACARLRARFSGLRLLVTGKGELDQDAVDRLGLDEALLRPGWVPLEEYPLWLSAVNVFALPFRDTVRNVCKWPMKVGDFMAVGRPTVSNPTGDIDFLFQKHDVGLLVDETPLAFERGLASLLSDPAHAQEIGREARHVAENHLSWSTLTARLEETYRALLSGAVRLENDDGVI